ncbi:MAG: LPS export ABC transporter periplasmic protein LptC [Fimbriimonadaceae bacterium]
MWATRRSTSRQICTEDAIQPTYSCAVVLVSAILLVGCGSKTSSSTKPSTAVSEAASKVKEKTNRRTIVTGAVKLESGNSDGKAAWKVNGQSARAGLEDGGRNEFFLSAVTGEITEKQKVSSTFVAEGAKASTETKKLVLTGNVKITSIAQKINLKADKITWMEDKELFAATGHVQIDSPEWLLGQMDEVWATPDLSKIGTPSKFK